MLSLPFLSFQFIFPHILSYLFIFFHVLSFPCPRHFLFFPFHVIQVARNPQIQELYFILAKPSIQEVFRSNLESFGHGYTPQGPEKQISKGSKESFSWFFSSRLSAFHFLTCAFSSVSFMLSKVFGPKNFVNFVNFLNLENL